MILHGRAALFPADVEDSAPALSPGVPTGSNDCVPCSQ